VSEVGLKKRGQNKASLVFLIQPSDEAVNFESALADLVEIIIAGLSTSLVESTKDSLATEKTQVECDSFRSGLSFANQPSFDSDVQ
jgi:hypothetical protein